MSKSNTIYGALLPCSRRQSESSYQSLDIKTSLRAQAEKANMTKAGQLITDGNVVWIIDDVRDGESAISSYARHSRDGFVKANELRPSRRATIAACRVGEGSNMIVTAEQYKTDCSGELHVYDSAQDKLTLLTPSGASCKARTVLKYSERGCQMLLAISGFWTQPGRISTA